jgi:hypothetical protein
MRRGRLVFNRVHDYGAADATTDEVIAALAPDVGARLAARAAGNLADFDVLAARDRATIERVRSELGEDGVRCVAHLNEDVRDLVTLARIGSELL